MAQANALPLLSQVPYFACLDVEHLRGLARMTLRRAYDAGQIVLLEGKPCIGLYVVEKDWLKPLRAASSCREQPCGLSGRAKSSTT